MYSIELLASVLSADIKSSHPHPPEPVELKTLTKVSKHVSSAGNVASHCMWKHQPGCSLSVSRNRHFLLFSFPTVVSFINVMIVT